MHNYANLCIIMHPTNGQSQANCDNSISIHEC